MTATRDRIAKRVFIAPADYNYAIARWSAINACGVDFFWMGAQAIEKYGKAILFINGHDTRQFGHDIVGILTAINDEGLAEIPEIISKLGSSIPLRQAQPETKKFIERIHFFGSPENRYNSYGHVFSEADISRLDFLVYHLRRACRDMKCLLHEDSGVTYSDLIKHNLSHWRLSGTLPLERAASGKGSDELIRAFLMGNIYFGENKDDEFCFMRSVTCVSVIFELIDILEIEPHNSFARQSIREYFGGIRSTKEERNKLKMIDKDLHDEIFSKRKGST